MGFKIVTSIHKDLLKDGGCPICDYKISHEVLVGKTRACGNCDASFVRLGDSNLIDIVVPAAQDKLNSCYQMVGKFQDKFGINQDTQADKPTLPSSELMNFKVDHILEELQELALAFSKDDLEEVADALVDLVYVTLGLAQNMNLPYDKLFKAVHEANMAKERVTTADQSKRGSPFDVIKPPGWKPADLKTILINAGAKL